ncbi:DUF6527 family protein [Sphaerotilus montanus]|jgi:hypothetical protein|uniref:DUF6527 family protein n=1 Tax=Sphaerotilus montanus TaxID=522889 RepID=UPI003FA1EB7A
MSAIKALTPVFVMSFPDKLEAGKLYVSMEFASVAHLCACGCGAEVVTPLSPTDWMLSFDGVGVTLDPSVGNWRLPCRSHYLVRRNQVVWAGRMPAEQIEIGRRRDRLSKHLYHQRSNVLQEASAAKGAGSASAPASTTASPDSKLNPREASVLANLRRWLGRLD